MMLFKQIGVLIFSRMISGVIMVLLIFAGDCYGQKFERFYDVNLKECSEDRARILSVIEKKD